MQNFSFKRLTAWLLTFVMLVTLVPANVSATVMDEFLGDVSAYFLSKGDPASAAGAAISAASAELNASVYDVSETTGTTYVLAGSDFQANSHNAGASIVSGLLTPIKEDYPTMNGFLFAGDYDVNYNDSANGKKKLQETVQAAYGTNLHEVYVQGNHDSDSLVGSTLSQSGANDAENYGVFVINEKDYMWYNNNESTIKNTAESLKAYLDAKINANYTKPIFVVSHLPLHYSMRTKQDGDGMYAGYIFDVLNEAGKNGLNIIFLFGHNHSHGWDDYLGGAAIFLTKGDKINIAKNSKKDFEEKTLEFTYMNAGYVGYYGTSYTSDVDKTLTMTTFAITDTEVTISRYDSNGIHNLKSEGVYNVEYPDSAYYSTNTEVVASPYVLKLTDDSGETEQTPVILTDEDTGITVTALGITKLEAAVLNTTAPEGYAAYASYDISVENLAENTEATVTIPVPGNFVSTEKVVVLDNGVQLTETDIIDGKVTFTTTHFSPYAIGQRAASGSDEPADTPTGVNNYPEYPNEGAVKVSKTGTGIDFQASGIAQVEVSASGVPLKKGADVIVMLDLSSSMNSNKVGGKTRLQILRESMTVLMNQLQAKDAEGNPMDIRIAVADFNRYYTSSNSPYYINEDDHLKNDSIRTNASGTNKVYTGSKVIDADAFVDVHNIKNDAFETGNSRNQYYLGYQSGTNYDYAFDAVYQLGEAITAKNETDGVERDLFVIFMSDGAPFQFNYFSAQSDNTNWNNWLQGTLTDTMFASGSNKSYYNKDGKHWMAEAIKGDPAKTYPVIRKNNAADTDHDNWVDVNGLGAKMYSIGFCLAVDKSITVASMDTVIRNIASSEQYYYRADSADDLNNAFKAIGNDIAYAAYNARFVDKMGANYDLQMKTATYVLKDGKTQKTLAPSIEILAYDIYTKEEADNDKIPTGKNIGDRKGTSTVLEKVTFSADGAAAYSTRIDGGKTNILAEDGVIYAENFWYNTTSAGVIINEVDIPTGIDSANLTTGSTNVLPAETFYWKMGTVQTSELAMRYYVYLDDSMEGNRPAGSYPTNEYATLYYDNYVDNPCYKETVSPVMAWKGANVSYAFYLVNEKGDIIVNQTTGQTGSFANKVAVTNPVVHKDVTLNSTGEIDPLVVIASDKGVLPEGYELYDAGAKYTVQVNSNGTGSWEIVKDEDKAATTYVTQFDIDDASAYSNAPSYNATGADYTHTVVWFAVVWKVQALPDVVVIDYGLPVDISVLTNDMFGENGKLEGVGAYDEDDKGLLTRRDNALAAGFGKSYSGTYGTAEINAVTGKVRYTPNNMQMSSYEKFAYAVRYTGSTNPGYYYDTVTVIPATSIYYEEGFLSFTNVRDAEGNEMKSSEGGFGIWSIDNHNDENTDDAVQSEDRPGRFSLTDANNIYGYDPAYSSYTTFSLSAAKKVTVNQETGKKSNAPQVDFTFRGRGFDIVSLTDDTSGLIVVTVKDAAGSTVKSLIVDNYYGYSYATAQVKSYKTIEKISDDQYNVDDTTYINDNNVVKYNGITCPVVSADNKQLYVLVPESKVLENVDSVNFWRAVSGKEGSDRIYQVPVIKVEGLTYGTYSVTIQVAYIDAMDHLEAGSYSFWMDAVRIYDPANGGAADGTNDTVIEDAYEDDKESNPVYKEIGDLLIAQNDLSIDTDTKGAVFIDGRDEVTVAVSDYSNPGPNNEVYLAKGQGIAFQLTADKKPLSTQIGAKLAYGTAGILKVNEKPLVENGICTATDMYYAIDAGWEESDEGGWVSDVIVLYNANTDPGSVISLTNIKTTFDVSGVTVGVGTAAPAAEAGVYMLRKMYESAPELFTPETFEASVTRNKAGNNETVTVVTSTDVETITVDGTEVTKFKEKSGERTWTYKPNKDDIADQYEIVAFNADGLASEPKYAVYEDLSDSGMPKFSSSYSLRNTEPADEIFALMEELANRIFEPEMFAKDYQKMADGSELLVVNTSEDVEYIKADGEIIRNYITETIVDLSRDGEETVRRVWLISGADENAEIAAYNADGVASESQSNG